VFLKICFIHHCFTQSVGHHGGGVHPLGGTLPVGISSATLDHFVNFFPSPFTHFTAPFTAFFVTQRVAISSTVSQKERSLFVSGDNLLYSSPIAPAPCDIALGIIMPSLSCCSCCSSILAFPCHCLMILPTSVQALAHTSCIVSLYASTPDIQAHITAHAGLIIGAITEELTAFQMAHTF
jgi:hypothetical protein